MNYERLATIPIDLARLAGRAILYGVEIAFPAKPIIRPQAANMTIYSTPPEAEHDAGPAD